MAAWAHYLEGSEDSINHAYNLCLEMDAGVLKDLTRSQATKRGFSLHQKRERRGPYSISRQHVLGLTKKEQEVLSLLVTGTSNQDMATELTRSRRTIENHVSSLLAKFNVKSRTDVILRVQNEPWLLPADDRTI